MSENDSTSTEVLFPFIIKDDEPLNTKGRAALIDVSHWQRDIDFAQVASSGVSGVYIKASEGMYYWPGAFKDNKYQKNWDNSKNAGLLRGAYHFARPQYDARRQAEYFAPLCVMGELPPAIDLERDGGLPASKLMVWMMTFINTLKMATGRRTIMLYTNGMYCQLLPKLEQFVDLWLSQPFSGGQPNTKPNPVLPKGWDTWVIWQYSWVGSVPGIKGKVDLNHFNGSEKDLFEYAEIN